MMLKAVVSEGNKRAQMIAIGGLINVKEWTGVHSSLEVSLHKR